mgnify:CR=1 FL=1
MFVAECKKEMRLRHWGNKELAQATGYKRSTIDAFFSKGDIKKTLSVMEAISSALNVPIV